MEVSVSVTDFKAKCLDYFKRLDARSLTRVTVTRRGATIAVITPPSTREADVRSLIGSMKGSVTIPPGFDLTAPVFDEEWDAESGILHR